MRVAWRWKRHELLPKEWRKSLEEHGMATFGREVRDLCGLATSPA